MNFNVLNKYISRTYLSNLFYLPHLEVGNCKGRLTQPQNLHRSTLAKSKLSLSTSLRFNLSWETVGVELLRGDNMAFLADKGS